MLKTDKKLSEDYVQITFTYSGWNKKQQQQQQKKSFEKLGIKL